MCRLLFLWNTTRSNTKIMDFLAQTINPKNTPGVNNKHEHTTHKDGFGFAWYNTHWNTFKHPSSYLEYHGIDKLVDNISKSPVIIGHIRNKMFGDVHYDNTHPFVFKDQVFVHNGFLRNFSKNKHRILSRINNAYKPHITGNTDSEHLFFLFLSLKDNEAQTGKTGEQLLYDTMVMFFSILAEMKLEIYANFIFANNEYALLTRYALLTKYANTHNNTDGSLSLYYDITNGIVISSEPITNNYTLLPENSLVIVRLG